MVVHLLLLKCSLNETNFTSKYGQMLIEQNSIKHHLAIKSFGRVE